MHFTNKDFPEITRRHSSVCVIAFPPHFTKRSLYQQPVIQASYKNRVVVQSVFISCQNAPFTRESLDIISPLAAHSCQSRVVILHFHKRATGIRLDISLTAEVLDYSFTSAVSNRGHVEYTPLLFAAVESQLSERQACSELIHCVFLQKCFAVMTASNSPVCCL